MISTILAYIINFSGVYLFFTPIHFPTSPFLSSFVFTLGTYFAIIAFNLYPVKYRKLPNLLTRIYEFFASIYLLELATCKIWFPFETFTFLSLSSLAAFLKRRISPKSVFFPILHELITMLQDYKTGIIFSYIFSISYILLILHGTYAIDLGLLRQDGLLKFLKDVKNSLELGLLYIFLSFEKLCSMQIQKTRKKCKRRKTY